MKRDVSIEKVMDTVCDVFCVEPIEVKSKSRARVVSDSRKAISYILVKKLGFTLDSVGRDVLGGRDHSTIINCIKKYNNLYQFDTDFRYKVDHIISKLWN